jgi:hypothetical protein
LSALILRFFSAVLLQLPNGKSFHYYQKIIIDQKKRRFKPWFRQPFFLLATADKAYKDF